MARVTSRKQPRKTSRKSAQTKRRSVVKVLRKAKVHRGRKHLRSRKMKGILSGLQNASSKLQGKLQNMSDKSTAKALEKIYQKNPNLRPQ